ncbi:peptidase [[Mycoplasma] phocae]|uniref:Peptidase n=1 Tax=[Mycoplasma] phocae TaxID=142651 RepID=A0A2Z5IQ97_9BACT|nr:M13 family metallopeptidase [[Mycoplasma] phocae]AXE61013.1 peptidase [[Mycoplasma] phocae]
MNKTLLSDDFYEAINGDWIRENEIPEHKSVIGSFEQIDEKLNKLKKSLLTKWQKDDSEIANQPLLIEMVKFYKLYNDWNQRKINGVKPLERIIDWIKNFESWKDIERNYSQLTYWGFATPIPFAIGTDFKNSELEILYMSDPICILPEKSYYTDLAKKSKLYEIWSNMVLKLMKKTVGAKEGRKLIKEALKWDEMASEYILSAEESAIYTNLYHPKKVEDIDKNVKNLSVSKILHKLVNQDVETIIAVKNSLIKDYQKLIVDKNFKLFKSFLLINAILRLAPYLDYKFDEIAGEFQRSLRGQKKALDKQKKSISVVVDSIFAMPFGKYYGEKYFGEKNKKNVEYMVKNMIQIYKNRLENNDWLGTQTKHKAIYKLSKIGVYVGYPTKIESFYNDFKVLEYDGYNDLLENYLKFKELSTRNEFSKYMKTIDKELWAMSPAIVNAYYSPNQNKIVFPAGILQAPFYSDKQGTSANYGGIGAVIAHEISHAFDNNGANFDENGNMLNWWTESDKKEFQEKANKMIELFEGKEIAVGQCNGKLTVSENIADAGGLACALEAAKLEKDFNAKKFYTNFAVIWKMKYREELQRLLLDIDVHAPAKLRANIQIQNSDDFYKAFDITEKDKMYLPPEKRVKIW